jgi:hypothetical protein
LTIDTANYDNVADRMDGLVIQAKIGTDATRGDQADETFTFTYDEI